MKRFKKILFISRSHEQYKTSLYHAVKLAYSNGAEIKFMIIGKALPTDLNEYEEKLEAGYITKLEEYINTACSEVNIPKNKINMSITMNFSELPDIEIIQKAARGEHDLIIKSIDEVDRGFKSFDMVLLRNLPCPIWFFRSNNIKKDITTIVAAVDANRTDERNTKLSEKIVTIGNNLAKNYNSQLDIISCWQPSIPESAINNALISISEEEVKQVADKELKALNSNIKAIIDNSSIDTNSQYKLHTLEGEPETLIPSFIIDHDVDMLVMGTVNRTGIPGFFIGNTAENVLHKITCSLLALKPEGFKPPISS